ncbi:GDSL-type esterase/lipase family protein [Curtobacterium sp. Leaf183]|uniref:GDSL-type esterase/lipase family protein n=1 Tax=Curtobacterium sp. Leaf183 TaxID=1736291 RepID=UPI0006FCDCD4|nr:GDSL-type esterase/lipase family protein [Curtobacterium sp. Leaf183]
MASRRASRMVAGLLVALVAGLATGCASTGSGTDEPLAAWNTAVADRSDAPARWVALGDSITEGQGASTRSTRWMDLTLDQLRKEHPTSGARGGAGYLPAQFAVYEPDSTWADWATARSGSSQFDKTVPDLGYRSVAMQAGASRTYPFTGTGLDIWWTRYEGSGDFTYSIDGGAPRTVSTTGKASTGTVTKVDDLRRGKHTVTVTAVAPFSLQGFTIYDGDRDKGIQRYDSAQSGATISTFTRDQAGFLTAMRRAAPDLVTITLGGNDAQHVTPAELGTQYRAFLEALAALPSKPSLLVIGEFTPASSMTSNMSSPWSSYLAATKQAATKAGAVYVSMDDTLPKATYSGKGIYSTDGIHPNDKGQQRIAKLVLSTLAAHDG